MRSLLTVRMRDVRPERVVPAVDDVVDLPAVAQQLQVHQARLVPGREKEGGHARIKAMTIEQTMITKCRPTGRGEGELLLPSFRK